MWIAESNGSDDEQTESDGRSEATDEEAETPQDPQPSTGASLPMSTAY